MYQIIGIQRNTKERLLATPATATEARKAYFQHQGDYSAMIIHAPDGRKISHEELNQLADEEASDA